MTMGKGNIKADRDEDSYLNIETVTRVLTR